MDANLPPSPIVTPEIPRQSFVAYVWRGDKFDEIGWGTTNGQGHLISFALGAEKPEIIELRATDPKGYPGMQLQRSKDRLPTFLAFFAGTDERAGTVWAHDDGKGHRMKLRQAIADGATIDLKPTGHYGTGDEGSQRRKPSYRLNR